MYNLFWIQNKPFFDNLKELKIHVYHLRILKKSYIYITLHIEMNGLSLMLGALLLYTIRTTGLYISINNLLNVCIIF